MWRCPVVLLCELCCFARAPCSGPRLTEAQFEQEKLYITYLGVKYVVNRSRLEGKGEGSMLARALKNNSEKLLQEHGVA
jgi:hypothetical protein